MLTELTAGDFYVARFIQRCRIEHMLDNETTELIAAGPGEELVFGPEPLSEWEEAGWTFARIPEDHPLHGQCCAWLMQAKLMGAPVHVPDLIERTQECVATPPTSPKAT